MNKVVRKYKKLKRDPRLFVADSWLGSIFIDSANDEQYEKKRALIDAVNHFAASGVFFFVVLPTMLFFIYETLIASERYVSESVFLIKQSAAETSASMDLSLFGLGASSSSQDDYIIKEYILSQDMLDHLDTVVDLRSHYAGHDNDIFSRLWESDSKEDYLEYYRDHISVYYDEVSSLITVGLQTFDRQYSYAVLTEIVKQSEKFVNIISKDLAEEQLGFVKQELELAKQNLVKAKHRLIAFQNAHDILSPEEQGKSLSTIIATLEADLSAEQTKLSQLLSYQNESAPQVVATKSRIKALQKQIQDESSRLVGEGGKKINQVNAEYQELLLNIEFATDAYKSTLIAFEQSRAEVAMKLKHIVVVAKPNLPDEALYPRIFYNIATLFVVLLMVYGILRMVAATIKEHKD